MIYAKMNEDPDLENYLQTLLPVIMPSQEFVAKLQTRLKNPPSVILEKPNNRKALLAVLLGLMGGLVFLYLLRYFRKGSN